MTNINISDVTNTVVITENGTSTIVSIPVTSVVTAITEGPQGPAGAAFQGYVYVQDTASNTWTINHNLGYVPSAEVFDSGSQEVDASVLHPSVNQTVILFTAPLTGFARLI